jgi:outer membrane immunogenic protein
MRKALLIVLAAAGLGASQASAADLPMKAPYMAPVPAVVFSWTGFYLGGSLGYSWSKIDGDFYNNPGFFYEAKPEAGIGGVFGGAQYQFNSFVFGVEAGYSATFSGDKGRVIGGGAGASCGFVAGTEACEGSINNILQAGGRLGFAFDRALFYGTGGWAQAKIATNGVVLPSTSFSGASATHNGWYAGAGIDYAWFNNFIVGVEYTHYDFDNADHNGGPSTDYRSVGATADVVRARASFKFP